MAAEAAATGEHAAPMVDEQGGIVEVLGDDATATLRRCLLDTVFASLQKLTVQDRSGSVRFTLARMLGFLLRARSSGRPAGLQRLGLEAACVALLLLLARDGADEVWRKERIAFPGRRRR